MGSGEESRQSAFLKLNLPTLRPLESLVDNADAQRAGHLFFTRKQPLD
jgi:hypothetical protein